MDVVVFTLLHQLSPNQSEQLFATVLWSLWKRKNLKLWQQKNETNTQVVERATHLLEDWRSAQNIFGGRYKWVGKASTRPLQMQCRCLIFFIYEHDRN